MAATRVVFGASGNADQPVVADWDGDGRDDIAAFRTDSDLTPPSNWFILPSGPNQPLYVSTNEGITVDFGEEGVIAAVGVYSVDGRPDLAVFDQGSGVCTIGRGTTAGAERTVSFGGTGPDVVPVLAPLYFRLRATGNLPDEGASGSAARLAGRPSARVGAVDRILDDLVPSSLGDEMG